MEVKQIWEIMNAVTGEVLGKTDLVLENLSNVVDVGTEIFNANAVDNYVNKLVNHIGRVVFVNRPYRGNMPSVVRDAWEYGSILEKITMEMPTASENETWSLEDGEIYEQNKFTQPKVSAKFFNKRVTFDIPMSITEKQVKESFSSADQLNGFLSMIYSTIDKSMTVKMESLIMRTVNNFIGETIFADFGEGATNANSHTKAVNLLHLFKERNPDSELTASNCIYDPNFIRFASFTMGLYKDRLSRISTLFNIGKKERFTPSDLLHVVLLSEFKNSASAYLQSDTYHDQYTELPNAESVPYWQGSGLDYSFESTSKINVITAGGHSVEQSGIIGVMFDRDALGVSNLDRRVTTHYNAKAEFYNNWYKYDAGHWMDSNENFVVFFVA